ncbi:MAG: S8 family serine peptidase [Thermoguttaceae bacterium]
MKRFLSALGLLAVLALSASDLAAQIGGTASALWSGGYGTDPAAGQQAASQIITWDLDTSQGIAVNSLVGADTWYSQGVYGQGTFVANVEAGLVWNGHETTGGVQDYYVPHSAPSSYVYQQANHFVPQSSPTDWLDMHATWVGSMIAGFDPNQLWDATHGYPYYKLGMAPATTLSSGAIATAWYNAPDPATGQTSTYFDITPKTFYSTYKHYFATAQTHSLNYYGFQITWPGPTDVINSSWGYADSTGQDPMTMAADGFARNYPQTALVVAAGNSTTPANPSNNVGGPASGYNTISVGAVGNYTYNDFSTVADFSSRGPQDYYDPVHLVVPGVRAAVDLVAPGTTLVSAYYGAQTGGNSALLSTTQPDVSGGANNYYSFGLAGTSFAAPIVSGGIALLKSAAYQVSGMPSTALDTRVIKAVLMNSATKLPGWNNGQYLNAAGVTVTTQSLDWSQGAGILNLDRAFNQYLLGTQDVPGLGGGNVAPIGWDYGGLMSIGAHNDYVIGAFCKAGTVIDATLTWFRDLGLPVFTDNANPDLQTLVTTDNGFANLDLELWNSTFTTLYAESISQYNNTQELHFTLPSFDGQYGLRVTYFGQAFGDPGEVDYGLAWAGTVPEPGTGALLASLLAPAAVLLVLRAGRRKFSGRPASRGY